MKTIPFLFQTLAISALAIMNSSQAGDIAGKVILKGEPPPEINVNVWNPKIAAKHPEGLTTRHFVVGPEGGLQNALVYIHGEIPGRTFEPPDSAQVLDHVDGLFQPYVQGVQTGQELRFKCADKTICTYIASSNKNKRFLTTPMDGVLTHTFENPELPVRFKCDLHPWNYAYVGVFDHPFFSVTDEQGRFKIEDVPPGTYNLHIFHNKAESNAQTVEVTDEPLSVNLEAATQ